MNGNVDVIFVAAEAITVVAALCIIWILSDIEKVCDRMLKELDKIK